MKSGHIILHTLWPNFILMGCLGSGKVSGNLKFPRKVKFSLVWIVFQRRNFWAPEKNKSHNMRNLGGKWILPKMCHSQIP